MPQTAQYRPVPVSPAARLSRASSPRTVLCTILSASSTTTSPILTIMLFHQPRPPQVRSLLRKLHSNHQSSVVAAPSNKQLVCWMRRSRRRSWKAVCRAPRHQQSQAAASIANTDLRGCSGRKGRSAIRSTRESCVRHPRPVRPPSPRPVPSPLVRRRAPSNPRRAARALRHRARTLPSAARPRRARP